MESHLKKTLQKVARSQARHIYRAYGIMDKKANAATGPVPLARSCAQVAREALGHVRRLLDADMARSAADTIEMANLVDVAILALDDVDTLLTGNDQIRMDAMDRWNAWCEENGV